MLILRNYKANPRVTTQNNTLSAPPPKTTPQVPSLHGQYVLLFSLISSSKNPFLNCSVGVSGSVKFVPCSVWLPLLDIILRIALLHEKKKKPEAFALCGRLLLRMAVPQGYSSQATAHGRWLVFHFGLYE